MSTRSTRPSSAATDRSPAHLEDLTPSRSRKSSFPSGDHARRHSLPFIPPSLWGGNASDATPLASEDAARGEHSIDGAVVARRISAFRQLNGSAKPGHRYAKSTGARNSTYSQPVIVRTYSGSRPQSRQKEARRNDWRMDKAELPPVEAFSFKGIMESIQHNVAEDLERIAEICARSRYSLSNQYEVHMPPHGSGADFLPSTGQSMQIAGPTLQAVSSDEEQSRSSSRPSRGVRRVRSAAYGTLETIISSSRSSDEDKTKKKPAADIVEEVRGRAMSKDYRFDSSSTGHSAVDGPSTEAKPSRPKHTRSKSASFATMIIDNAQTIGKTDKSEALTPMSPTTLISEPARPQTSIASDLSTIPGEDRPHLVDSTSLMTRPSQSVVSPRSSLLSNGSTLRNESESQTIWSGLASWFSWNRSTQTLPAGHSARMRSASVAEGTLRQLLHTTAATKSDKKGKAIDLVE